MQFFAAILAPVMFFALLMNQSSTVTNEQNVLPAQVTPSPRVTPPPLRPRTKVVFKVSSTPSPTSSAVARPFTTPTPSSSNSLFLDEINSFRSSRDLSKVTSDSYSCSFAKLRAQEISISFNHDGFNNRLNSHTLPYPSFHEVTENIAMNSNQKDVMNEWINSPGHAANMQKDTPFVCVQKYGNYYVYEGYKP